MTGNNNIYRTAASNYVVSHIKKTNMELFVESLGVDICVLKVSLETPTNINSLNALAANPASGSLLGRSGSSAERGK